MIEDRVVIVVHSAFPADPRVRKQVQALRSADIDVTVLCLREEGQAADETWQGARVRRLPVRRHRGGGAASYLVEYAAFFLLAAGWLSALALRRTPRVVQVATLPDPLIFAALLPKLAGSRLLLDLHELMPEFLETRFRRDAEHWSIRVARALERVSCAFADRTMTVSEPLRRVLVRRGVPADDLTVVLNSAPMPETGTAGGPARASGASRQDDRFVFVYHGLVSDLYDLPLVLDALAALRRRGWNAHLRVIGDGPELPRLREQAERLELGAGVRFDGYVAPERIPAMLAECDAGVVPLADRGYTRYALPTKLFECLAAGLPVVTTRMPTVEHYFGDDVVAYAAAGDVASLEAAMTRFREDPGLRVRMRDRALDAARAIRWERQAQRYVDEVARLGGFDVRRASDAGGVVA